MTTQETEMHPLTYMLPAAASTSSSLQQRQMTIRSPECMSESLGPLQREIDLWLPVESFAGEARPFVP